MTYNPDGVKEKNMRGQAITWYFNWLLERFRRIPLMEIADEPEPISLRKVYVDMRVDTDEMDEKAMSGPSKVVEAEPPDKLPGRDVWDLLIENPFVLISGLPGSGKTTLSGRLVLELADTAFPSAFRKGLSAKKLVAPIPLVLRDYAFDQIRNLDQLLEVWWQKAEEDANELKEPGMSVDKVRLRYALEKEDFENYKGRPAVVIFDGIDEVGGLETRTRVYKMAREARKRGFRVVVTGRPAGYADLQREGVLPGRAAPVYHLMPFTWPQIDLFVNRWYGLKPDWKLKREQGIKEFLGALQDPNRPHLLQLARRPIFITLMALVHLTRNVMPHGRAELYKNIVDLYLVRQEEHRRLRKDPKDRTLETWPPNEKRLVLGYVAWKSQLKGSESIDSENEDSRRVIWKRGELIEEIARLLRDRKLGRFTVLKPEHTVL